MKTPGLETKNNVEEFLEKLDGISQKMAEKKVYALRQMLIHLTDNPFLDGLGFYSSLKNQIGEEKVPNIYLARMLLTSLWINFSDGNNGYPRSSHHLIKDITVYLGIFIQRSVFGKFPERREHFFLDYLHAVGAFMDLLAETEEFWETGNENKKGYTLESID